MTKPKYDNKYYFKAISDYEEIINNADKILTSDEASIFTMIKENIYQILTFDTAKIIYKTVTELEEPVENKELMKLYLSYQAYYLSNYWTFFKKWIMHMFVTVLIGMLLFVDRTTPTLKSSIVANLISLTIMTLADIFVRKGPNQLNYIGSYFLMFFAGNFTIRNLMIPQVKMYEVWPIFDYYALSLSIAHFMEYKKIVVAFFISKIAYLTGMKYTHGENLPFEFFGSNIATSILFIFLVISASKIIRHLLKLIYENKELISTIKNIIEVFPEAVLIKTVESTIEHHDTEVKFINNSALENLVPQYRSSTKLGSLEAMNVKIRDFTMSDMMDGEVELYSNEIIKLTELLKLCEDKVLSNKSAVTTQIEVFNNQKSNEFDQLHGESSSDEELSQFYTLKSVLVRWENAEDGCMHVFVDRSDYMNFEKEKETNQSLQMMFSGVSHEFRTPINAFNNALSLIEINHGMMGNMLTQVQEFRIFEPKYIKIKESIDKFIKISRVSSITLLNLTEDILDLAKMEAGIFKLNEEPFVLKSLVDDINYVFSMQFQAKGVQLNIIINNDLLDQTFNSDVGRIKQITSNLLSNSLKFTNKGSVTVRIWIETKFESRFSQTKFMNISISDTGVGICEADSKHLFKMFGMINKYRSSHNSKGTGLGLTISKKLAKSLGGDITVRSKEGYGTTFTVTIKNKEDIILGEPFEEDKSMSNHGYLIRKLDYSQSHDIFSDEIPDSTFFNLGTPRQDIKKFVTLNSKFINSSS